MNANTIHQAIELFKQPNELIEVRLIGNKVKASGYFRSAENLIKAIKTYDNCNIYFVLNRISEACYAREQREKIIDNPKNTTSDNDITNREWFLIDVDPKRASGVSASNEEKEHAKQIINKVYVFLRDKGFASPVICDSGNGFHLLYKINMPNIKGNADLLKSCLQVLDLYFSNEFCDIDKSVFNASRITKLYGDISKSKSIKI